MDKEVPDEEVKGIVALRSWNIYDERADAFYDDYLRSTFIEREWKSDIEIANRKPGRQNLAGLHCISLEHFRGFPLTNDVVGLIEVRGKIVEHEDGIYRAEWARILKLFFMERNCSVDRAEHMHKIYGCPIVLTDNLNKTIMDWLDTDGVWYKKHNEEVTGNFALPEGYEENLKDLDFLEKKIWGEDKKDEVTYPGTYHTTVGTRRAHSSQVTRGKLHLNVGNIKGSVPLCGHYIIGETVTSSGITDSGYIFTRDTDSLAQEIEVFVDYFGLVLCPDCVYQYESYMEKYIEQNRVITIREKLSKVRYSISCQSWTTWDNMLNCGIIFGFIILLVSTILKECGVVS